MNESKGVQYGTYLGIATEIHYFFGIFDDFMQPNTLHLFIVQNYNIIVNHYNN